MRPISRILCTFDGELVPFSFAGISSGLHTRGHRFLSEGKIEAKRFDDYAQKLKAAHVVLEADERAAPNRSAASPPSTMNTADAKR